MTTLLPCPGCQRHVRVAEQTCPFCSIALEASTPAPERIPDARLGRSAFFPLKSTSLRVAGIVAAASAVTCSTTVTPAYGTPGPPIDFDANIGAEPDATSSDAGADVGDDKIDDANR
jgi:hypothetical protein